jgi:hypothetical protein
VRQLVQSAAMASVAGRAEPVEFEVAELSPGPPGETQKVRARPGAVKRTSRFP